MATEISAITIGVGSLPTVPSMLSSPFSPFGSVPLSETSSAVTGAPLASVIGLPFGSRASPDEVAWLVRPLDDVPPASGSIVTVKTTWTVSPTASGAPVCVINDGVVLLAAPKAALAATVAAPLVVTLSMVTPINCAPNCVARSSRIVTLSRPTFPVFSQLSVNVTSKLSPLATASPAVLARPIAGRYSGVASSLPPVSPSAPAFGSSGSVPLSERSMTITGMPAPSRIGLPS